MITDIFFTISSFLLSLLVKVFPEGAGFPQAVHDGAQTIGGYARMLDPVLPFDTLYIVVVLTITLEIALLTFRAFRWVISHVPFVGGKG